MVDPALARLLFEIREGMHSPSSVNAAKDILDRAGFKPVDKVQVDAQPVHDPGREALSDALLERLIAASEALQLDDSKALPAVQPTSDPDSEAD